MAQLLKLSKETCKYRGEGNASLVMSLNLGKEHKVLRVMKEDISEKSSADLETVLKELENNVKITETVISPLLGEDVVHRPSIVLLSQEDVRMINEISKDHRPAHRCHKVVKGNEKYALVLPDHCALPIRFANYATVGPVVAVEIKPKQGYFQKFSHVQLHSKPLLCTYCMRQYYKLLQKGPISKRSGYCPLDLYSGCPDRMMHAVLALLDSPQNNIRVFKDQELVYSEEKRRDLSLELYNFFDSSSTEMHVKEGLSNLIVQALTKNICSDFCESVARKTGLQDGCANSKSQCSSAGRKCKHSLPETCILDRILRIQLLDSMDIDDIYSAYCNLKRSGEPKKSGMIGVLPICQIPENLGHEVQLPSESYQQFASRKVWEFLLALTLKDCSIMLTFARLNTDCQSGSPPQENVITNGKASYLFSLACIDLDMKAITKVEKIHKDRKSIVEAYLQSQ